jgi:hypothetical protein
MFLLLGFAIPAYTQVGVSTSSQPDKQSEVKEPVISLWENGSHSAKIKPFLLFAVWEDGKVLWRGDVGKAMVGAVSIHDWAKRKITIGSLKTVEVFALQSAIAKAGFFRPPLADGMCFIDGPSQSISVRYGKAHRRLRHDPSKRMREHIADLTSESIPSREDAEAFANMWDTVANLINSIAPVDTDDFRGELALIPPEPFEATDENGNPCIAYRCVPEYNEIIQNAGTPRSLITMTTVQIVTPKEYQTMKQAGNTHNEERHGDWLYFSVSGIAQIPNDTSSMGVTARYKLRLEARQ